MVTAFRLLAILGIVVFHAIPTWAQNIELFSDAFPFDQAPGLRLTGLEPGAETVIKIEVTDHAGDRWFGQSVYVADENGVISPATLAPIRGMYEGVQAAGPFWSMVGVNRFETAGDATGKITVSSILGELVASRTFIWQSPLTNSNLLSEPLNLPHLDATLYLPSDASEPIATILLLGGSGGGANQERAALLVRHGYAVVDIAYFGTPDTPSYFLETFPLERIFSIIDTIESDHRLAANKVAIMGRSYGAQLALILASHEPRFAAVIAEGPSNMISGTPSSYPNGEALSAWSVNGKPLPFHNGEGAPAEDTLIPVERFGGPVLLISGADDKIWPATEMAEALVQRRTTAGLQTHTINLTYPNAGHNFGGGEQSYGVPNLPPKDRRGRSGGTEAGNSIASIDAWAATLAFLEQTLKDTQE